MWFLSITPRVQKVNDDLIATTCWFLRIITLGLIYRQVTVSNSQQAVIIARRYFWLFAKRRKIAFNKIQAVTYGYSDFFEQSKWSWAYDPTDIYTVGLKLHRDEELHLFYFMGDGSFTNDSPLPDWMYWENYLLDWVGPQERESKLFVELVSKMIGTTITPPSH